VLSGGFETTFFSPLDLRTTEDIPEQYEDWEGLASNPDDVKASASCEHPIHRGVRTNGIDHCGLIESRGLKASIIAD
jgi:hypothetical protein